MNIPRRLVMLLGAFGAMTAVAVVAFTLLLRHSSARSAVVTADAMAKQNQSYVLLELMADTHSDVQRFLRLKDPDEMEKALKELTNQQKEVSAMVEAATGSLAADVKPKWDALLAEEKAVIDETLKGNVADGYERFFGQAGKKYEALLNELRQQHENIGKATAGLLAAYQVQAVRSLTWQSVGIGLAMVVLIVVGWRLKNRIVRELQRICVQVADSSTHLARTVDQMSSSGLALADGASQQAASLEETGASLEEISSMTERNAENVQKACELARDARNAADGGASDMAAMAKAMNEIKSSSDDIFKIIKTIDEIAFQTNILALNAAVEAARAGDAGMGFAVVAQEVRHLAQRSAQAAGETAVKIEGAIAKTAQGVQLNDKVSRALAEIVAKIRQVAELVNEVAGAFKEQSQGVGQVNLAIANIGEVTQTNAAHAEESATASEGVSAQVDALKRLSSELLDLVGTSHGTASPQPHTIPQASGSLPAEGSFTRYVPAKNGAPAQRLPGPDHFWGKEGGRVKSWFQPYKIKGFEGK